MYLNVKTVNIFVNLLSLCTILIFGISCGKQSGDAEISRISIYSIGWNLVTITRMSCTDLKSNYLKSDEKPTIIKDTSQIRAIVVSIENANLVELTEFDGLDVRVCCEIEDSAGNVVVIISFSPTSMMQIGNKIYETDESLFRLMLSHLPSDYLES